MRPPSPPSSASRQVALGLLVGLALVVAVQLADPGAVADADPSPSDLDGPAADLAAAMTATERTSHVEREARQRWNGTAGDWGRGSDRYARLRYDPEDHELLAASFLDEPPGPEPRWTAYVTGDGQWSRVPDGEWRVRYVDATYADVTPFDPAALSETTVTSTTLDDGTVRYDLHNDTGAIRSATGDPFSDAGDPRVTVLVDGERGLVERVSIVRASPDEGQKSRVLVRYGSYGEASVERPDGIPSVSGGSLFRDLVDGPLFSPYR